MRRCAPDKSADTDPVNPPSTPAAEALAAAERAGIDLSLIEVNLSLSYEERLLRHDAALELAQALRTAGHTLHQNASPSPAAPKAR